MRPSSDKTGSIRPGWLTLWEEIVSTGSIGDAALSMVLVGTVIIWSKE